MIDSSIGRGFEGMFHKRKTDSQAVGRFSQTIRVCIFS
jgi:hypothetical protein